MRRKRSDQVKMNSLRQLEQLGQSVWLDTTERGLISAGKLTHLIEEDGLSGLSSSLARFQKAVTEGQYDSAIRRIPPDLPAVNGASLLERLVVEDCQRATDLVRETYERTGGDNGYVSIGLPPHVAHDVRASITEAHRLWETVHRPNVMIQIPAAAEGLPAIEQLIADGINVDATLIFSVSQYDDVAQAYLRGIERSREPNKVASVASFVVSPIDRAVDSALEELGNEEALRLRGKAALAIAQLVHRRFVELFLSPEFEKLRRRGVRPQKPAWVATAMRTRLTRTWSTSKG